MDENLDEKVEEGKIDMLNPAETGTPQEARGFSMAEVKKDFVSGTTKERTGSGFSLQRTTTTSDKATQDRINDFLNGASKEFVWDERKFQFNLGKDNYYCYSSEQNGVTQAAIDFELTDKGIANLFRMRTDRDASRAYFQDHGKTLGQEMFQTVIEELKQKGAKEVYAEVTEDGYRFLKRQAEQGMISLTVDVAPKEDTFGLIRGKIV